jgi:polyhydroxyalkanoate synthase subunit PhaC
MPAIMLSKIIEQSIEQVNTVSEAFRNLSEIKEVEIGATPHKTVWEEGKVKLYHFIRKTPPSITTPVLISYALVNRWEMMDLQPERSFIKKLLSEGADVFVIDWGYATRADRYKTMEDYVLGNINDCVDFIRNEYDLKKINLLGVCQGGTFSIMYAALHPEKIKNFVTLVTPFDFDISDGLLFKWAKDMDVDAVVDGLGGVVPGDFLNSGFDMLAPLAKFKKYSALPETVKDKNALLSFLSMEKWVGDSPAQAGETYRKFIKELYQQNKLIKGEFSLNGCRVDINRITMPVLTVYGTEDHIVPPSSTIPFHEKVISRDKELIAFPAGHIGVFVGSKSQKKLAPAVAKWLADRDEDKAISPSR